MLAIIRRSQTPRGDDAELVVRLADRGLLPLYSRDDRLRARQRLSGIGRDPDAPAYVRDLMAQRLIPPGDGVALAESLLPASKVDFSSSANGGGIMYGG